MIPVDLFGQAADYAKLLPIAKAHNIWVLCDAAQAFGARVGAQAVCTFGLATATSFFPSKPLGCYGDGGAIFTDDDELHALLCSLRVHGKGNGKYDNVRIGTNSRLDTLQAAILLEKLALFSEEIALRQLAAKRYTQLLEGRVAVPAISNGNSSVWAQYTILLENADVRSRVQNAMQSAGIPTMIYYPIPMHRQEGYRQFPTATGAALPVSEALSQRVLSLPMHPYLTQEVQSTITECLLKSLG
jgi:dTDP-4-amino-4,6-dideoxygalactose transaminase